MTAEAVAEALAEASGSDERSSEEDGLYSEQEGPATDSEQDEPATDDEQDEPATGNEQDEPAVDNETGEPKENDWDHATSHRPIPALFLALAVSLAFPYLSPISVYYRYRCECYNTHSYEVLSS